LERSIEGTDLTISREQDLVSVVIPCFNEADVLSLTNEQLIHVLEALRGFNFEIVYVDDGSGDETPKVLKKLQDEDGRIRVVRLSRNFGHQAAITAGLAYAAGDAVILMDADLQDPPELIPEMLARWEAGSDVVYGTRTLRAGESRVKRGTASIFYRVLNLLSDVKIPLDSGDFRLMDRRVVDAFLRLPERQRFVRGLVAWMGFRQTAVPYKRNPRAGGQTKYPFRKMLHFALDGIVSFSLVPLRLLTWLGFLSSGIALAGVIWALLIRLLTDRAVAGWTATFIAILFMGGVQLVSIGVIGEYVGRIYGETKARPLYLVEELIGFDYSDKLDNGFGQRRRDIR
jgi:glycosyltransferase involved in cell wall biosynthesis